MKRLTRDTLGYLLIIAFCIALLTWAIPTYTPAYPGYGAPPALVPNVAVLIMLVMACLLFFRNVMALYFDKPVIPEEQVFPDESEDGGGFTQIGRVSLVHLARIMAPCLFLLLSIDYIGYIPASLVFLVALQYLIGSRRWIQSIVVAVALVAVLYIVMRYGFGVPVPGRQFT